MNILPGEPVPPGFEDEVNREAEIQQAIDQYKGNALVGLEYTVELNEEDRREPGYFCVLCDKRGDPRTIMQHWTSFNHRFKYLEKHYPTAVREFNSVKYKPNSHTIMNTIVQSLAEAIEDHHGRLTLSVCNGDEFRRTKAKIVNEVNGKFHYDERNGPNFVNIIDRSLWETNMMPNKQTSEQTLQITIKAPKRINSEATPTNQSGRDGFDEISSDSEGGGPHETPKKPKKREQSPAYRVLPRVRRSPPFEEERAEKLTEKKLPTPKELSLQASHIAQERYKWEKYRCMLEIHLKQMEKLQQDYEKNPEKHPLYPEEWKKFWNRRYKELQAEKKVDPNKHDYKPEWIVFWTGRMKELFNAEVEQKKKEIKVKLELPENAEEKVDQLKEKYKVQVSRNATALNNNQALGADKAMHRLSGRNKISSDVIDISDDESSPQRRRRTRSRSNSRRSRSRSNSRHSPSRRIYKRSRARSGSKSSISLSDEEFERRHSHHHIHRHSSSRGAHVSSARSYAHAIELADYYGSTHTRSHYVPPPPPPHSSHYGVPIPHYRIMDPYQYPKYDESQSLSASLTSSATAHANKKNKEDIEPEEEGPLTVVAVLRLLTALEDHLGSLGPKVVDLLGKALSLEKVKANSADDLLLNEDHCVFFETIKEKLKGLLIADVIDDSQKIRAVKRAIKNIAATVHQVNAKGNKSKEKKNEEAAATNGSNSLLAKKSKIINKNQQLNIKDLPFDRQVVATKLAAALVLQGREDVSTEDMDKLIYLFVLLVKLSKEKYNVDGKPLRMKDVLSELGISVLEASALAALPGIVDELLENEVSALVQEVEEEISNDTSEKETKNDANTSMLESLTDSDLQTLLQNFKHLSTEEQHHLVAHLKKLETADPLRVEKLRKFVNLGDVGDAASTSAGTSTGKEKFKDAALAKVDKTKHYTDSPAAASNSRSNYSDDESNEQQNRRGVSVSNPNKFSLDDEDEDDDYTFDDVFKVASSNVNRLSEDTTRRPRHDDKNDPNSSKHIVPSEPIVPVQSSPSALTFNPAGLKISLSDTQNIIANLMGSLQQSNNNSTNSQTANKNAQTRMPPQPVPMPADQLQQKQKQQQQQQPQQQSTMPATAMSYYQQNQPQQQQAFPGGYNQMAGNMNNPQAAAAYYGATAGYNNVAATGYAGYQQWGNAAQMQNMQPFGMQNMQNFMTPTQQQQQQPQSLNQMGYNMYGRNGN